MEHNETVLSLQNLLKSDMLDAGVADNITTMLRREKENQVLKIHTYKISGPFKSGNKMVYNTRAPWTASKKLSSISYERLIDTLYDHYFDDRTKEASVQDIFEKMVEYYESDHIVANLTLIHYKADWRKYIVEKQCKWLHKPIKDVSPGQIFDHYRRITADCVMRRSTFNNVKTVVNAVFDYAYILDIPVAKASLVKTSRLKFAPEKDKWEGVYTVTDRKRILDACEQMAPTVYTKAIELMFCLDIRIGELRALYKEDVDLQNRTIFVGHQMVDVKTDTANRHPERVNIMKGGQEAGKRTEPLSGRALKVIEWLFENYPDTDWLLPNQTLNGPIYMHRFNDNLKRVCKTVGVRYFSSHGIRFHTISAMYDAGVNEKEIQRLSGHTTARMTQHYNKTITNAREDEKIRQVLG